MKLNFSFEIFDKKVWFFRETKVFFVIVFQLPYERIYCIRRYHKLWKYYVDAYDVNILPNIKPP